MASLLLTLLLIFAPVFLLVANKTTTKRSPATRPDPVAHRRKPPDFRWVLRVADGKDITCIRLGAVHTIVVNSPDLGHEFLKKHDASFASHPLTMATEYSGRGSSRWPSRPGETNGRRCAVSWRRKCCPPPGSGSKKPSGTTRPTTLSVACTTCASKDRWSSIDVRQIVRDYCGNVIRRIMFGRRWFGEEKKPSLPGKEEVKHVDAAFAILSLIYAFCPSDFMPSLRFLYLNGHERIARRAMKVINKYHRSCDFGEGEEMEG